MQKKRLQRPIVYGGSRLRLIVRMAEMPGDPA
jgi:hypothetical protein